MEVAEKEQLIIDQITQMITYQEIMTEFKSYTDIQEFMIIIRQKLEVLVEK